MAKPEITLCWYRLQDTHRWKTGRFHQWGLKLSEEIGEGSYTVAIVEDARTGAIVTVEPSAVNFGADPDKR